MILYLLLLLFGVYLFNHFYWKRRNLPPGPTPLPLLGNVPSIVADPPGYGPFLKWRKQYGEIYTYWLGNLPVVAVADYKLIQETFIKDGDSYSGRKNIGNLAELIKGGDYGMMFIDGDYWKEQRKFALHAFRNLGMGKNILQEKILIEVDNLMLSLEQKFKQSKTPEKIEVDIAEEIEITVASVINQMLFGFSYSTPEEREEFGKLKNLLSDHMVKAISPELSFISTISSLLRFVPPFKKTFEEYEKEYKFFLQYFENQIEKHLKTMDENCEDSEIKDFTEAYLREISKNKSDFNKKQLLNILYDFWIAGQETTSNTTIFGIMYSIHFPETQKKIHEELEEKINSSRRITLEDRNILPYIQGFVNEVQRFVNLLPMNLLHATTKEVTIKGFTIPEGTCILPQISNILYDENYFKNPMTFNPERFLDENGNSKKIEEFIPFSVGKRQCLGESIAKMELFLIFSNLFNQFKIKPVSEDNLPSLKKKVGVAVQPEKFTCVLEKKFK